MKTREKRMITGRVEIRALTDAEKSDGYIGALTGHIPLNSDSVVLRDRRLNNGQPFVERIAPKAFAGAEDVMAMAGHTEDTLAAFARQGVNLTITESATELRWDALIPNTSAGRDLLELGAKKIVRGTSFEFGVGATDKWEKRSDGTAVRTVEAGTLLTVNPVIWPAYDESDLTVSMRSRSRRAYYVMQPEDYIYCDDTASADLGYALASLGGETAELTEALRYLRENPQGAHAAYATQEVADASAAITALTAWLAANGATVPADMQARATKATTEAREKLSPTNQPQGPRDRSLRILHR